MEPKPTELQELQAKIDHLCEQSCEVVSDQIDPTVNVSWMRCSPDLPKYIKGLEDRITELEIQEAGWFRAASMLRVGMGLSDGSDLRECLLTFNQLRDKLDHAEKCCAEMRAALRYVAYQRLPLGNLVVETLPEHWHQKVEAALKEGQ